MSASSPAVIANGSATQNHSSMVQNSASTAHVNPSSMSINKTATMTIKPSQNKTFTPSHMTFTPSHNMTVTPSQTIPTPPVTPTPTPTPTSTPIHPEPGNFTVTTKNHTVCLFAYMAATFHEPMNISKVWKYLFALFSNGSSLQQILNITMFRVLVIMNDFIYPSTGKMYGKEPLYNETLL